MVLYMEYKDKYIKYKTKYLKLKNMDINNQNGGSKKRKYKKNKNNNSMFINNISIDSIFELEGFQSIIVSKDNEIIFE